MAARLVLNDDYQIVSHVPPGDINRYVLGAIGEHKIVLAVMPDGEYGKSSALSVATHMLRTFPNIRVGFMVGVGGGAPSKDNDIRMGDVVISRKEDGKSGVFEFDYGKKHQSKSFEYTSHLNSVPTLVMTTIAGLKSRDLECSFTISRENSKVLAQNRTLPSVRAEFDRPSEDFDVLFKSTAVHNVRRDYNLHTILGAPACLLMMGIFYHVRLAPVQIFSALLALAGAVFIGNNIKDLKSILFINTKPAKIFQKVRFAINFARLASLNHW